MATISETNKDSAKYIHKVIDTKLQMAMDPGRSAAQRKQDDEIAKHLIAAVRLMEQ